MNNLIIIITHAKDAFSVEMPIRSKNQLSYLCLIPKKI